MPKVVLFVTDVSGSGGAETVFVNLIKNMNRRKFTPVVMLPDEGWLSKQLNKIGIDPIIVPMGGSFNLSLVKRIISVIKRYDVTVINAHLFGSSIYCAIAAAITKTPLVSTFHGIIDVASDERLLNVKSFLIRKFASKVIFVSQYLKQRLNQRLHIPEDKCAIIYNGLNLSEFEPCESIDFLKEYDIDSSKKIIAMVGNANHSKGYDIVMKVAEILGSDYQFLIAGEHDSQQLKDYQSMSSSVRIGDQVKFIGFVNNVTQFLSNADIYLLSSRDEGFSLSTIEAMACKVPVVSTKCGGPEEIIVQGENGILVENENPTAIAEAIQAITKSNNDAMIDNAWHCVNEQFSIKKSASEYYSLFNQLSTSS